MIVYKLVSYDIQDPLYQTLLDTYTGINDGIISCTFENKINEAGNMQFSMSRAHPAINMIEMYNTTIGVNMRYIDSNGVVQDEWWPFVGRVISISRDIYGNKTFSCEGVMNFLNDTYMAWWEDKYSKVKEFLKQATDSYNEQKMISYGLGYSREIWFNMNKGHGLDNAFTHSKDYDKEEKKPTYFKTLDGINNQILEPYGGVIYFRSYPYYDSTFHTDMFRHEFGYYDRVDIGFDYSVSLNSSLPQEYTYMPGEYGGPVPCFGIADNITNITEQPVKTDIWTGLLLVYGDGITRRGSAGAHDLTEDDVYWIDQSSSQGFVGYSDRIVKAVDFSELKAGDSVSKIDGVAQRYLDRFANLNYFTMRNYTINGIEPCEVFDGVNKIVKPGFPVIIDYEYNEGTTSCPCISIKHDVFNIESSEYEAGPIIPQNIINEDISTWK